MDQDERLERFRAMINGVLNGALDAKDITDEALPGLFCCVMVAAREAFFDHDSDESLQDEVRRLLKPERN